MFDFCYDGGPIVFFPLKSYLDVCSAFFSFLVFGNCSVDWTIQVPGVGVYGSGNLPECFVPVGRFSLSGCVLVFKPLISPCP
jgi:hypothetical protein